MTDLESALAALSGPADALRLVSELARKGARQRTDARRGGNAKGDVTCSRT
jgi:hypothetical protein